MHNTKEAESILKMSLEGTQWENCMKAKDSGFSPLRSDGSHVSQVVRLDCVNSGQKQNQEGLSWVSPLRADGSQIVRCKGWTVVEAGLCEQWPKTLKES